MNKVQLDELYHELRKLCVTDDVFQKEAIAGITSHLTQPCGDYTGLLRFLSYYGEEYILPSVVMLLHWPDPPFEFSRVIELGSGFGWLGRGISRAFNQVPVVFIDKRQWALTDIVTDIETENGVERVLEQMQPGDLVVMSELLHCLEDPKKTLTPFRKWPMLVVEYQPVRESFEQSYNAQIKKFGCKPIDSIRRIFSDAKVLSNSTNTHCVCIVFPVGG